MPIEILDTMQEEYERRSNSDKKLGEIRKQIKDGATYQEAEAYGTRSGEILSDVLQGNITEDVFNGDIPLEDLIVPMMRANYDRVVSATSTVQSSLNKSANIGMKAIVPDFNEEEAINLVAKMLSYDSFEDAEWLLGEPVVTNSLGIVTDMLHANADFQFRSGMSPKIVRTAEPGCCDWCASLEGVYEYRDLSSYDDVWKRHANCRCEVTYVPGDGRAQDSWSKAWIGDAEPSEINSRIKRVEQLIVDDRSMYHRRIGERGREVIDQPTYNKLTKDFLRRGGIIERGPEWNNALENQGASGAYFRGANLIILRDDATVSEVLEELFHAKQDRENHFSNYPETEMYLRREIEAQKYVLNLQKRYKMSMIEIEELEHNLAQYEKELDNLLSERRNG